MIIVGAYLVAKSRRLAPAAWNPKPRYGARSAGLKTSLGKKCELGMSHRIFTDQSTTCWKTRLQGPNPEKAAIIATELEISVAATSPIAKRLKWRARLMRAFA